MSPTPALDLDRALAALAPVVARPAPPDRLILALHADLWRDLVGHTLPPADVVLPFGSLDAAARRLVGLWVLTALDAPSMRAIAATVHPPTAAFIRPARSIARRLPPSVLAGSALRREECLRRWAAAVGAPVRQGGEPESAARSQRVLQRLDYTQIRAEEQRLAEERAVAEGRRQARAKIAAGGVL